MYASLGHEFGLFRLFALDHTPPPCVSVSLSLGVQQHDQQLQTTENAFKSQKITQLFKVLNLELESDIAPSNPNLEWTIVLPLRSRQEVKCSSGPRSLPYFAIFNPITLSSQSLSLLSFVAMAFPYKVRLSDDITRDSHPSLDVVDPSLEVYSSDKLLGSSPRLTAEAKSRRHRVSCSLFCRPGLYHLIHMLTC